MFRFDISRRLTHASYRLFYIHEKSILRRIKIKSNRSGFANDSNAKLIWYISALFRTRKKKKKRLITLRNGSSSNPNRLIRFVFGLGHGSGFQDLETEPTKTRTSRVRSGSEPGGKYMLSKQKSCLLSMSRRSHIWYFHDY